MNIKKPFFSVIIPALNEEKYLPRLLKNLENQTDRSFEVIVVDGKSEDKTVLKAQKFSTKFPLTILTSTKRNVSYQRNLGASDAHGKVLIFFDADTQIPSSYLKGLHTAFDSKHPHLINTWVKAETNSQSDVLIATGSNLLFEAGKILNIPAAYGAMIAVKKGAFEDIGGFDEQTAYAEDSQFVQNALKLNYKYLLLKSPKYIYSLRRFKSEGTLDALLQYFNIITALIKNGYHGKLPAYPMGGHVFKKPKSSKPSLKWIDITFKTIQKTTKKQRLKLNEFLKTITPSQFK